MPKEITLEPNWPNTAKFFASALSTHSFDFGAKQPVGSFMEIIRYLAKTNPVFLDKLIKEYRDGDANAWSTSEAAEGTDGTAGSHAST